MRYLAIFLLLPWLLILCWGYWSYPKSIARSASRRTFDLVALMCALGAAVTCALRGFDAVQLPAIDQFGRASGGIWQQVFPALYGYGAFTVVLLLALIVRQLCWRHR